MFPCVCNLVIAACNTTSSNNGAVCFVVDPEEEADKRAVVSRLVNLRRKLAEHGIDAQNCPTGQKSGLICPTVSLLSLPLMPIDLPRLEYFM